MIRHVNIKNMDKTCEYRNKQKNMTRLTFSLKIAIYFSSIKQEKKIQILKLQILSISEKHSKESTPYQTF